MSFRISEFKENVKIVRPNLFNVELFFPANILSKFADLGITTQNFKFRCEATELPGRTIATNDDQTFGPTRKFAYDVTYNDVNLQIIVSEDMNERKLFEAWMGNIVTNTNRNYNKFKGGIVNYYDNYAKGRLIIRQLDQTGAWLTYANLYDCYPIQLSPMNLSFEEQNTYQRFTATMTYRYHVSGFKYPSPSSTSEESSGWNVDITNSTPPASTASTSSSSGFGLFGTRRRNTTQNNNFQGGGFSEGGGDFGGGF